VARPATQARAFRHGGVEKVLPLYRDKYFDLNVRHFHEKLREQHQINLNSLEPV
jgi:hypothetical protein